MGRLFADLHANSDAAVQLPHISRSCKTQHLRQSKDNTRTKSGRSGRPQRRGAASPNRPFMPQAAKLSVIGAFGFAKVSCLGVASDRNSVQLFFEAWRGSFPTRYLHGACNCVRH
jgi:hypothetical protein